MFKFITIIYKKAGYTILFIENKIMEHLEEIQETATKRVEEIVYNEIIYK